MVLAPGSDVVVAIEGMEDSLALYVGGKLMGCDDEEPRTASATTMVAGASKSPADAVASDAASCEYFPSEGGDCRVVLGGMTLFMGAGSSAEDAEAGTLEALRIIAGAMNDMNPSPFLGVSGESEYEVDGVVGVRFIEGTTAGGMSVQGGDGIAHEGDDGGATAEEQRVDAAAAEATTQRPNSSVTTGGAVLLGVGLLAIGALVLLAVRKKRRSSSSRTDGRFREFKDEAGGGGEEDLDGENDDPDGGDTDVDATSLASSPPARRKVAKKRAYVVGEEGSVRTHATHDTRMLHAAREVANGNGDDMRLDVHYCTSAVCPICNGGGTRFVSAVDDDDGDDYDEKSSSVVLEGYEYALEDMHRQSRSFEYKPKGGASAPSYTNPAGIAGRPYIVDDTIEF